MPDNLQPYIPRMQDYTSTITRPRDNTPQTPTTQLPPPTPTSTSTYPPSSPQYLDTERFTPPPDAIDDLVANNPELDLVRNVREYEYRSRPIQTESTESTFLSPLRKIKKAINLQNKLEFPPY
jgi:hypothetical protein